GGGDEGPRSLDELAEHWRGDFFRAINRIGHSFDLVFADPPYALWDEKGGEILPLLLGRLAEGTEARLICEAPGAWSPEIPAGWQLIRRLAKGPQQPSALIIGRENGD
ncbi:hypothetical protein JIN80_13680, partial [Cerasicoccus arenae]